MKNLKISEHDVQKAFIQWFKLQYKDIRIFAIPNGGKRHISVAKKLKAEGVVSGVPDLFIPGWYLWIEVKTIDGKLSKNQKEWLAYLESIGYNTMVVYGIDDAMRQVAQFAKNLGISPLKAQNVLYRLIWQLFPSNHHPTQ